MNAEGSMVDRLTPEEKTALLRLARRSIEAGVGDQPPPDFAGLDLTPALLAPGAAFVTLTIDGSLRGCIGALEPYQSLAEDVREHAAAAALDDYRFPPLTKAELPRLRIEISRLTLPVPLDYTDAADLVVKLRPGVDGVILKDGGRRATFLPQVWEKIPQVEEFLDNLCLKMGAAPDLWRRKHLDVLVYQVEEFHE